jgi:hypothetical protein
MRYLILLMFRSISVCTMAQQNVSANEPTPKFYSILLKLEKRYTDSANWTQDAIATVQRHFAYNQGTVHALLMAFGNLNKP